jgi:hypothetical protein
VIDEMATAVFDASGHVRHVNGNAELARSITAATLRFPVPQPD